MRRLIVVATFAFSVAAQTTWTVNSAGGAMFTAVQPAIAASVPGDRIEVQGAGPYAGFIVDRGVDVEAPSAASCGTIQVVGIPMGQRARVSGFRVVMDQNGTVVVQGCSGNVILANLLHVGSWPAAAYSQWPSGLTIAASARVLVDSCNLRGANASGGVGAHLVGSRAVFCDGSFFGGMQTWTAPGHYPMLYGYDGMRLEQGSHVSVRGTVIHGGSGGSPPFGGYSGDAVRATASTALILGDCELRGGNLGVAANGDVRYTPDTVLLGATISATPIPARPIVTAPSSVPIGSMLTWQVSGAPGQLVALALDLGFTYAPMAAIDSAMVLTSAAALQPPLLLDAQGSANATLAIPSIPALRHLDVIAQGAAIVGGGVALTVPTVTHTQ